MFCIYAKPTLPLVAYLAVSTFFILTSGRALGAVAVSACPKLPPTIDDSIFQQPINATRHFDLQVVAMRSPANNNLSLLYRAVRDGKLLAFNPTLLVNVGGTIDFTLQDCLSKSDIKNLQNFIQQDTASDRTLSLALFRLTRRHRCPPPGISTSTVTELEANH